MENIKHVGVVVAREEDLWQGTRTALGLAVGNYYASLFMVDVAPSMTEEVQDNLEWLEDMECVYYSDRTENKQYGFTYMPLEKIGKKLKEMDIVIPFGNRPEAASGRMDIVWLTDDAA
jgi:hypothetical protein